MDQVKQLRTTYTGLAPGARRAIIGVAALTALVLLFVVRTATHTSWAPVAAGVKPEKVGEMQTALTGAGIQNQLGEGGTSLEVPTADVSKARVALASAGQLTGGSSKDGYAEMFGTSVSKYGMTNDQFDLAKLRAVQANLQSDIEQLGFSDASVNVVTPDEDPFSDDASKPTAAVQVQTDGEGVTSQQVKAITQLVAFSVQDMKATDVTVVDDTGQSYTGGGSSAGGDDAADGGSSNAVSMAQAKLRLESTYNAKVQSDLAALLTPIVGKTGFVVSSNATIDVDKVATEEKSYGGADHAQGLMNEEQVQTEKLTGQGAAAAAGVAGTGSNATNPTTTTSTTGDTTGQNQYETADTTGGGAGDYSNVIKNAKFDNDAFLRKVDQGPGNAIKGDISVVVDSKGADGKPLDSATQTAIQDAVAGYAAKAGDKPVVSFATLAAAHAKVQGPGITSKLKPSLMKWVAALVGLGLLGFFVRRQLNLRTWELLNGGDDFRAEPLPAGAGLLEPVPLRELEAAIQNAGGMEQRKRQELQRKVEQIATEKPGDVATQLRGWLKEDRR